jgi:Carboxypeptidase regulatory-like domain/TonB dependent receptor
MGRTLLLSSIVILLVCSVSFAQSDRGTITGTIADQTSAVIPGASVVVVNGETGTKYETISTETGNYTLTQVPPGVYSLSVELPGFKRYVRQGITVLVAQTLRIDISLEVGAATDEVTVSADAPLLRTESSDVSHNVNSARLDELPILGIGGVLSGSAGIRNPYAMVQLIPGSTWTPNSLVRLNGTPANTQSFRIEGQDASNTGTPGVPAQSQPGVDAIQEVAIQTSNYAAEYGQVGGGVFNVTMKSGTNQFHGTVYDNFVNEVFNAGNPFKTGQPNTRPRARRNDYGFTIGGPIRRDRTFFFVNFEQFRETQYVDNQFQTVPTLAYRNGDFSTAIPKQAKVIGVDPEGRQMLEGMIYDPATTKAAPNGTLYRDPFPNNIIPKDRFDPVALKIQALFPMPNGPNANDLINNYIEVYPTSRVTQVPSFKIDHLIGTRGKLSFFWQKTKTTNPNGNTIFGRSDGLPDPISEVLGTFQNAPLYRLNYDYTVSPRILLHLGAGYRANYFLVPSVTRTGQIVNYNAEKELGLKGGIENKFFPTMSGFLNTTTGGMKGIGSEAGSNQITQSPSFNAYVSWVKNNHSYKFGSEFRTEGYPPVVDGNTDGVYGFSAAETGQPFQAALVNGANVGFGYASFLLGQVDSIQMSNPTRPRMGKKQLGIYAQDSWKVTSRFTLEYGLRYDYSTYLREQYGRAPEFSPTTIHPKLGIPGAAVYDGSGPGRCDCDIAKNYPYAFGPRLGVAYQVTPKTVFRAGFGIVYSSTASNNNAAGGLAGSSALTPAPSFGIPVTTLAQGIPTSFRPAPWPSYDAGYFPTVPNGSAFVTPGTGPVWMDPNAGRPARQAQWSIGFQREINRNLVVDLAYVGNRGVWWQAPGLLNWNANTPERLKSFGLDVNNPDDRNLLNSAISTQAVKDRGFKAPYAAFPPNQTLAQALRPFPQFANTTLLPAIPVYWNPMGKTWYDAMQVKVTQRFSRGLTASANFSWSKALTLGTEIGEPNPGTTGGALVNNVFDRNSNKYISRYDQPFFFNTALNYTTPRLATNKILSSVLANWTIGAFLQYASGFPLQVPQAQTALNNILFQGTSFANRVPGKPVFNVDLNCHCYDPNKTLVLNKDAWVDPPAGQFGTSPAYYSDYRSQRRPMENLNFGRTFKIGGENSKMSINLRMELTNIFNRAYWSDPSGTALTNFKLAPAFLSNGNLSDGFGRVVTTGVTAFGTTANLLPRQGVLVGRFTF